MQKVYLDAFYLGVREELEKAARCWEGYEPVPGKEAYSEDSCRPKKAKKEKKAFDVSSMPLNENILPNISNQTKWKYVRTKDGLRLTDGNLVYSFSGFPEEYSSEDLPVSRAQDDNILDFEKDAIGKGTAQVHRSSPDNIYMTLADGAKNPTFMLQHEGGQTWRYSPSKKFIAKLKALGETENSSPAKQEAASGEKIQESAMLLDPESLLKGASCFMKEAMDPAHASFNFDQEDLANFIRRVGYGAADLGGKAVDTAANHPLATGAALYGAARGVGAIRDALDPERKKLREIDPVEKLQSELGNIAFAALPTLAARAIKVE